MAANEVVAALIRISPRPLSFPLPECDLLVSIATFCTFPPSSPRRFILAAQSKCEKARSFSRSLSYSERPLSRLLSMIATHSDVGSVGGIADRNEISAAERTNTRPLARPRPELRETGLYHTNRCITLLLPSDRDRDRGRATRVCASYLRGGGGGAVGGIRPAAAAQ